MRIREEEYLEAITTSKEIGAYEERERIIKLLEAESRCKGTEHNYNGSCYCDTIALIKGENK